MTVQFNIHYFTNFGQNLMICGSNSETGGFDESKAVEMVHIGDGHWQLELDIKENGSFDYRYFVSENGVSVRREWGNNHHVVLSDQISSFTLYDFWQVEPDMPYLYTTAFTDSLLANESKDTSLLYRQGHVVLKVFAPFVLKGQSVGISGDSSPLGNWDETKALRMTQGNFPEWSISLKTTDLTISSIYKFVIIDNETSRVKSWEWGEPRHLDIQSIDENQLLMYSGMNFRFQEAPLKGSGVAIPVFSLRSENSWGCGDFGDLIEMTEWAVKSGLHLIQLLPVNDTNLSGTWKDSYPYNAVSIYALHPIYISISKLHTLKDEKLMQAFEKERKELEALPEIDYERTLKLKSSYLENLYTQEGKSTLKTAGFRDFFKKNSQWLVPYAAFSYLRNTEKESDFRKWGEYSVYDEKKTNDLCKSGQPWYNEIAINYFIQYLLHKQLTEAKDFAHKNSVVLKGDIPIGINRFSVEAWTEPHLFNMDSQIGAPPDDFSETGQNWGFPAYNWDNIAKEDYKWWKRRFTKMADYFDAYRIDHILGFFRIWEIPKDAVEGLLGHFDPALPFNRQELNNYGFRFEDSMTEPFINDWVVESIFKDKAGEIKEKYLTGITGGYYKLKEEFSSQVKIRNSFGTKSDKETKLIRDGLYKLCDEVLFIRDPRYPELLHPRISAQKTYRFQSLDDYQKDCFKRLHDDFFYRRNVEFWKQKAFEKLPNILNATRMLACGEDLGMIPSCVPEVMRSLNILSLEIQRMPKTSGIKFGNMNSIPYMSVCTTSTHDMNPIRAWWLEKYTVSQQYYNQVLWKQGKAPKDCTPEIARDIIQLHLYSPAMWAILPWQDWMAMDGRLRRENPEEERINIPANPRHYWRYRMHMSLEQLLMEDEFNNSILKLNKQSGRC